MAGDRALTNHGVILYWAGSRDWCEVSTQRDPTLSADLRPVGAALLLNADPKDRTKVLSDPTYRRGVVRQRTP